MKRPILAIALLLAACGPQYQTNYTLNKPASAAGQLCSANVIDMSNACVAACRQMSRQCMDSGPSTQIVLGNGGWAVGQSPLDNARDCSSSQCEASCLAAARQAHQNCGGTVTEQTVCTANCPTQPK